MTNFTLDMVRVEATIIAGSMCTMDRLSLFQTAELARLPIRFMRLKFIRVSYTRGMAALRLAIRRLECLLDPARLMFGVLTVIFQQITLRRFHLSAILRASYILDSTMMQRPMRI